MSMFGSIRVNAVLLGAFAILTTLLIAGTYLLTKDRIAQEQRRAEEKALLEIVPRQRHDNSMLDDFVMVDESTPQLGLRQSKQLYIARQGNQAVAVIVPATAPDGYSGDIDLVVGVNRDGSIAGVRVLNHRETPGLGDKVDLNKSSWVLSFDGRSLKSPTIEGWAVRKDGGEFDQFTGATITPRAVVAATQRVLHYVQQQQATLFGNNTGAQ